MSRAYVRPITRKQALSYDRLVPNGIGVTTIAAVNGRGAAARHEYAKRYEATRKMLTSAPRARRNEGAPAAPASPATTAAKPNRSKTMAKRLRGAAFKRSAQYQKMMAGLRHAGYRSNKGKSNGSPMPTDTAASMMPKTRKKRGPAKPMPKGAFWKTITVKGGRGGKAKKKVGLLKARVGNKVFKTYMIRGKGGKVRHVPDYMLGGFASMSARNSFLKKASPKRIATFSKREARILPRRVKRAERLLKRAQADRPVDIFTPNAMSYSEWSKTMKANKKRSAKKGKKGPARKRRQTAAQKRASLRNLKKARSAARRGVKRSAKKTRRTAAKRRSVKRTRRAAHKRHSPKRAHKHTKRRAAKRRTHKRGRRHAPVYSMIPNRRRRRIHANKRRRHHRNGSPIADLLMTGLAVGAGFAAHRALRQVISENLLTKIDAFNKPISDSGYAASVAYRTMIAGAATALVGVGFLQAIKGKVGKAQQAITEAQGGMIASVVLDLISGAIQAASPGSAVRGYLSGFGEYTPVGSGPLRMAQAGFGSYYPISGLGYTTALANTTYAQAGMGRLAQAAANGVGEYFSQNIAASGLGEYFSPGRPTGLTKALPISGFGDTSIPPRLSAAEYALTTAEAVAGLGDDAGETSIVDAWQVDVPVTDADEASSKDYGSLSPFVSDTLIDYSDASDEAAALRTGVLAGGSFG